jgi:class 3 adenylate cyclase/CHASE2 domain-containing sensor protein
MRTKRIQTSRPISALVLGLAATLAVATAYVARLDRGPEGSALDLRFRYLSTAAPGDNIVHVDIDDRSLSELGRWPWPRAELAGIVEVLEECGAKAVALDVILPEPQPVRYVSAAGDIYSGDLSQVLGTAPPQPVFDDSVLAATLAKYPNVFLPMHVDFQAAADPGPLERRVSEALARDGLASLQDVMIQTLPGARLDAHTAETDAVRRFYLRARALQAMGRFGLPLSQTKGYPVRSGVIVPPLVTFAQACRQSGFVTFQKDDDNVVRRIRLLAPCGDQAYPQLALSLAAMDLGGEDGASATLTADASAVSLHPPERPAVTIPIDDGCMLINWMPRRREQRNNWLAAVRNWLRPMPAGRGPQHVSAAAVGAVWTQRQNLDRNRNLPPLLFLQYMRNFVQGELLDCMKQADELYKQRIDIELERQRAALFDPSHVPAEPAGIRAKEEEIEALIERHLPTLRDDLDFLLREPDSQPATSPEDRKLLAERAQIAAMRDLLDRLAAERTAIEKDVADQVKALRSKIEGKICLVGSTATGAADFVTTPLDAGSGNGTPGVSVHANILNTILSGGFIRASTAGEDIVVILLAGAIVALLAAMKPVYVAGPLVVLLGAAYAAFNAVVVFGVWNYWLAMVAPLAAMLASFVVVTAYRQFTEERAKRHIRGIFANTLSPELVDQVLANPDLLRLGGERRQITCFFSDLAGFTPLSERLGEQKTVQVLNRYFDRMTEIIQNRRGGYLNKFLGDGLFVFFGAPVFQDDHARRALLAAVDCQKGVLEFNAILAKEFAEAGGLQLSCRVGVATGQAMVGNCGSSQKTDYTAIGDCVNLGSRLEGANKSFGTHILVDEETWKQAGATDVPARPMGRVRVVGRNEPVAIWNVLTEEEIAAPEASKGLATFAEGIDLFQRRRFAEAARAFRSAAAVLRSDKASAVYLELCERYVASPPPANWDGVLQLTEK